MSENLLLGIIKNELLDIVGYDDVTVREAERLAYSMDFYLVPQLWIDRHQPLQKPDFIVFPESAAEVARIHKIAGRHGIPVIPYGGGTGSQGSPVVKPAHCASLSQTIGVRQPSRPLKSGQNSLPYGSCRSSNAMSASVSPSSSPW